MALDSLPPTAAALFSEDPPVARGVGLALDCHALEGPVAATARGVEHPGVLERAQA